MVRREDSRLQPLGNDLGPEARALAESLRTLFKTLDITVTRYALRSDRDKGAISRYLNGCRVPPWEFVVKLQDDTAKRLGRPVTSDATEALRELHRAALGAANPHRAESSDSRMLWPRPTNRFSRHSYASRC